jgi:hypothetical protein
METYRSNVSMFEPATYRMSVLGTLDKKWSDDCCGMTIEHGIVLDQYPMTTLTGLLIGQSALIAVFNTLYDRGYPIISVECIEAQ